MGLKLVFIGPQGSGKGTQARILSEKLKIPHISTGDLLRDLKGELKEEADSYMNSGKLVPDEFIIKILKKRLENNDCDDGFILDGFPRNLKQAELLTEIVKIDKIIEISIPDEESVKRISGRRLCKKCNINYNIITAPKPKQDNLCDQCGSKLIQREDDKEDAVKKRLETYHKETEPILEKFDSVKIDGNQSIEEVNEEILSKLK